MTTHEERSRLAKVGLRAVIDEATGFQHDRAPDALRRGYEAEGGDFDRMISTARAQERLDEIRALVASMPALSPLDKERL